MRPSRWKRVTWKRAKSVCIQQNGRGEGGQVQKVGTVKTRKRRCAICVLRGEGKKREQEEGEK